MDFSQSRPLLITCAKGVAPFLEQELRQLQFPVTHVMNLGVFTQGSLTDCIRLNMQLRTSMRVLYLFDEFRAANPDELYAHVRHLPWEQVLSPDGFVSITSAVMTESITDTRVANLKCKDALVDYMQERFGQRPNSGPDRRNTVLFLYWKGEQAAIYLDTSGETLSRRGYRKIPLQAPMQETLGAAVISAMEWDINTPFVNPMCGSGTLAIEAALIALNKAPGLLRNNFGFMHINGYTPEAYQQVRKELRGATVKSLPSPIIASDADPQAVEAARQNAKTAGVDLLVEFQVADFRKTPLPDPPAVIVLNPAYGVRLNEFQRLKQQYKQIGDFFKLSCQGYRGFIFTGNLKLAKHVGLKTKRRFIFFNGSIESRLLEYELYEGSRKVRPSPE